LSELYQFDKARLSGCGYQEDEAATGVERTDSI